MSNYLYLCTNFSENQDKNKFTKTNRTFMKKRLYSLLLMAVALFSAATLVSCSNDDDDEKDPEPLPVKYFARYTVAFSEALFTYCDVTVTLEADGQKHEYKLGEDKKVAEMNYDLLNSEASIYGQSKAGRVLEIPAFEYDTHPLTITTDVQLNEAGKKLVANAGKEEIDVFFYIDFGACNEKGLYGIDNHFGEVANYRGTHVVELESFLAQFKNTHRAVLTKAIR